MNIKLSALLLGATLAWTQGRAEILVKSGEKIGFMGDSITEQGNSPNGYVGQVIYGLHIEGVEAEAIPAGVSGHTSANMMWRVGPQVLDKGADWMTLSCGVNDVMHQAKGRGVLLDAYQANVKKMVEACLAKKVRVVVLTPTPLGEDLNNEDNAKLAPYVEFLHTYAKEQGCVVADVNAAFGEYLRTPLQAGEKAGSRLLADGVHPNQAGQTLMAKTVLLALGVPAEELPKIEQAWLDNPRGKAVRVGPKTFALIGMRQYAELERRRKTGVVKELWDKASADGGEAQEKIGALVEEWLRANK